MSEAFRKPIRQKRPFASLEEESVLNLLRTAGVVRDETERVFRDHQLRGPAFNVLRVLAEAGRSGLPSQQISERMLTRAPDITRLVDKLEDRELVKRERKDGDRRVVLVRITRQGTRLIEKLAPELEALHVKLLGHMKRKELRQLSSLLEAARCSKQSQTRDTQ